MNGVCNPMNDLPMMPQKIPDGVDFCLVTHIHLDHFTKDYLPKGIKIVVQNEEDEQTIRTMGFSDVIAFEGNEFSIGSITVTKVPAVYGDNAAVAEEMGSVSGFILSGEDKTLYIAGDTVFYYGIERTLEEYKPDVIVLNCCEATLPFGRLIMNLSDVETVCNKAPEALVIATHLDSVNHSLLNSDNRKKFVQRKGLTQICVPENGEWIEA